MHRDRTKSAYTGFLRAMRDKSLAASILLKPIEEEPITTGDDPARMETAAILQPGADSEEEVRHA